MKEATAIEPAEMVFILRRAYPAHDFDYIENLTDRPANQGGPAYCIHRLNGKLPVYIDEAKEVEALRQSFLRQSALPGVISIATWQPPLKGHAMGAGAGNTTPTRTGGGTSGKRGRPQGSKNKNTATAAAQTAA